MKSPCYHRDLKLSPSNPDHLWLAAMPSTLKELTVEFFPSLRFQQLDENVQRRVAVVLRSNSTGSSSSMESPTIVKSAEQFQPGNLRTQICQIFRLGCKLSDIFGSQMSCDSLSWWDWLKLALRSFSTLKFLLDRVHGSHLCSDTPFNPVVFVTFVLLRQQQLSYH